MRNIKKILIHIKSGSKFLVKDLDEDYITQYGIISKADLKKDTAESNKKQSFAILNPSFPDLWDNLQRGPQVMIHKDIGMIIAKTGINKDSKIVDAGGGSGSLCLSLANICKEITVYEINKEHFDILNKNKQAFGFNNITLKLENISNGIAEKNLDLITLDLPEPWKVIEHAQKALKMGGFLVAYLPNLNQVKLFLDSTKQTNLKILDTLELIERKWKIEDKIMRPEFEMLGHTGFLTFCRKI